MMQKSLFLYFITALCFTGNLQAVEASSATAETVSNSFVFDYSVINGARETVKRVGWTEAVIDAQQIQPDVWKTTVKAALFSNRERTETAVDALNLALQSRLETFKPETHGDFNLLLSLDCLKALPEWYYAAEEKRKRLSDQSNALAGLIFDATPESGDPLETLHHQLLRTYVAALTGNLNQIEIGLHGAGDTDGIQTGLKTCFPGEGFQLEGISYRLYEHLLIAAKALKVSSNREFENLLPWFQRTADTADALLSILSKNPSYSTRLAQDNQFEPLTRFMELSGVLFESRASEAVLQNLYSQQNRKADALLFGKAAPNQPTAKHHTPYRSTALPRTGAAVLHDASGEVPIGVLVDTGLTPPSKSGLLSLVSGWTGYGSDSPAGRNTVYVDRQYQDRQGDQNSGPRNALITSFVPFDQTGAFLSATAAGQFGERAEYPKEMGLPNPVQMYQRDVYVSSPYVIDLFRIMGGSTQDYVYHVDGSVANRANYDLKKVIVYDGEYRTLLDQSESLYSAKTQGIYNIETKSSIESHPSERIWFVDPAGSELLLGDNKNQTMVVNRRAFGEMTSNLFAVVHEFFDGTTAPETKVTRLELDPKPNERDFQAAAFAIERNGVHDLFFSSLQPDAEYKTTYMNIEIKFQGKFGHLRYNRGEFELLRLVGGTHLAAGNYRVAVEKPLISGVLGMIDEATGTVTAAFPFPLPLNETLSGAVLQILGEEPGAQFIQPLSVRSVMEGDSGQVLRLAHYQNLSSPPKALAAPVRTGNSTLFESFAELRYHGKEKFSLLHIGAVSAQVEATGKARRVFIHEAGMLRTRGELKDGSIHFQFTPEETVDGRVEVSRAP